MTVATLISLGSFILAVPGAIASSIDQFEKYRGRVAQKKGLTASPAFSDKYPVLSASLTVVMIAAVISGFWFTLHRSSASHPVAVLVTPPASEPSRSDQPPSPITPKSSRESVAKARPALSRSAKRQVELPSQPQSTYTQKCEGSACAQGPGSSAILNNNYAPQPISISDGQVSAAAQTLRSFPLTGQVDVIVEASVENADTVAKQLWRILHAANISGTVEEPGTFWVPGDEVRSGLSFEYASPSNKDLCDAIEKAFLKAGIVDKPIKPLDRSRPTSEHLVIVVRRP